MIPRGIKFPFRFHAGSVVRSEGDQNIREAVSVLLGTAKGEYLYLPEYGADLRRRIFDSTNVVPLIKHDIQAAIARFEPRVEVVDIETEIVTNG
jgi:phage baseplate assembly protein W